jgi:hypothetical protein
MTGSANSVGGRFTRFRRTGVIRVPLPAGATRANPISSGSTGTIDGWGIRVLAVQFMPPDEAEAGRHNVVVTIAATYRGKGASQLSSVDFHAVGDSAVGVDNRCGFRESKIDQYTDVFTGGTIQGDVCFPAKTADLSSLVMYVDEFLGPRIYVALEP